MITPIEFERAVKRGIEQAKKRVIKAEKQVFKIERKDESIINTEA